MWHVVFCCILTLECLEFSNRFLATSATVLPTSSPLCISPLMPFWGNLARKLMLFCLPTEVWFSQWDLKTFVSHGYDLYLNNGDALMRNPEGLSVRRRKRMRRNGEEAGESPSGRIQQGRRQHGKGSRNTPSTWLTARSSLADLGWHSTSLKRPHKQSWVKAYRALLWNKHFLCM